MRKLAWLLPTLWLRLSVVRLSYILILDVPKVIGLKFIKIAYCILGMAWTKALIVFGTVIEMVVHWVIGCFPKNVHTHWSFINAGTEGSLLLETRWARFQTQYPHHIVIWKKKCGRNNLSPTNEVLSCQGNKFWVKYYDSCPWVQFIELVTGFLRQLIQNEAINQGKREVIYQDILKNSI